MEPVSNIIAERTLSVVANGAVAPMRVRLFATRPEGDDWFCAYEIDWPGAPRVGKIGGVDSVQALQLAMQAVAADLNFSRPPGVSDVYWLEPGGGVGFPAPPSPRDTAAGDDGLI